MRKGNEDFEKILLKTKSCCIPNRLVFHISRKKKSLLTRGKKKHENMNTKSINCLRKKQIKGITNAKCAKSDVSKG